MKQKMIICISILIVLVLTVIIVLNHPAFSRTPRGERLVRIERSPNYKEGQFVNQEPTPFMTTDKSRWRIMWDNLTEKKPDNLIPSESIHAVKTDLKRLNLSKDAVVWFGHSSYLLINGGKKILVDPVLTTGFPVSLMMKPFKGTDIYSPEDIPEVDYLIITHDHYDHLDYGTVKASIHLRTQLSDYLFDCPPFFRPVPSAESLAVGFIHARRALYGLYRR